MISYGTRTGEGPVEETLGVSVSNYAYTMSGQDSFEGEAMLSSYLAEQDADGDGLPDEGKAPAACTPFAFTAKRLNIMPPCIPTPLPGQ